MDSTILGSAVCLDSVDQFEAAMFRYRTCAAASDGWLPLTVMSKEMGEDVVRWYTIWFESQGKMHSQPDDAFESGEASSCSFAWIVK